MARTRGVKHVGIHPDIGSTPFAQYAALGWSLEVACFMCKRLVIRRAPYLVETFGPGGNTFDLERRFRCKDCNVGWPAITAIVEPRTQKNPADP